MASTQGLEIEIRSREGGPSVTLKQAHAAVRKAMQGVGVPRVKHERFDQSHYTIIADAAAALGCGYNYHVLWSSEDIYTFIFDFTNER